MTPGNVDASGRRLLNAGSGCVRMQAPSDGSMMARSTGPCDEKADLQCPAAARLPRGSGWGACGVCDRAGGARAAGPRKKCRHAGRAVGHGPVRPRPRADGFHRGEAGRDPPVQRAPGVIQPVERRPDPRQPQRRLADGHQLQRRLAGRRDADERRGARRQRDRQAQLRRSRPFRRADHRGVRRRGLRRGAAGAGQPGRGHQEPGHGADAHEPGRREDGLGRSFRRGPEPRAAGVRRPVPGPTCRAHRCSARSWPVPTCAGPTWRERISPKPTSMARASRARSASTARRAWKARPTATAPTGEPKEQQA